MGLAEAIPSRVAALGVPCTHEGSALQAQAGLLGGPPTLRTLRLSQMQKQVLHHSIKSSHTLHGMLLHVSCLLHDAQVHTSEREFLCSSCTIILAM